MPIRRPAFRILAIVSLLALVALASGSLAYWLSSRTPSPTPAVQGGYPALLQKAAADTAARLAPAGSGLSFTALQRQVLYHVAGAPDLTVPNPSASASPLVVDSFDVGANVTRGFTRGSDFFMEIRGIDPAGTVADFDQGKVIFQVITHAGTIWRNEGQGWYTTDTPPGLGIDPFSLSHLPGLLGHLVSVKDLGDEPFQGQPGHHFSGFIDGSDWPGFTASDGVTFTSSPIPIDVWVSPDGRLLGLSGQARNLNHQVQDLEIVDGLSFAADVPAAFPAPSPTRAPLTSGPSEPPASGSPSAQPSGSAAP